MALLAADPGIWLAQGIINTSIVAALLSETEALSNWTFCNEQESTFPARRCATLPPSAATFEVVDQLVTEFLPLGNVDRTAVDGNGLAVIVADAGAPPVGTHHDGRDGRMATATALLYLNGEGADGTVFPAVDQSPIAAVEAGDMLFWKGTFANGTINPKAKHRVGSPSSTRVVIQIPLYNNNGILAAAPVDASQDKPTPPPPPSPPAEPAPPASEGLSSGAIGGIVVGAYLGVAAIGGAAAAYRGVVL